MSLSSGRPQSARGGSREDLKMQSQNHHLSWLLVLQRQAREGLLPEITLSMVFKAEET